MTDDVLRVAVLTVPCLFGLWTAVACRRAQYHGLPGSDALVWAGLSGAFFLLSLMKTARAAKSMASGPNFIIGSPREARSCRRIAEWARARSSAMPNGLTT